MQVEHVVERDRFPELVEAVRKTLDRERISVMAEEIAVEHQESALVWLTYASPEATSETLMTTGHDHTSIKEGWDTGPVSRTPDGAEATVINRSEHVDWQRSGTAEHIIPFGRSGVESVSQSGDIRRTVGPTRPIAFWLGAPLKWPVHVARFAKTPGIYSFLEVTHPGFGPWGGRDFVEVAADDARPELEYTFRRGMKEVLRPLEEFFKS